MSEWWTYRLSNFLLFSPRTYYRLLELYNAAIWPAQVAAFLVGLAILVFLVRPTAARARLAAGLLAACWIWVAVAFHAKRYATINFAAAQFAWAFGVEAALLLLFVMFQRGHGRAGGARPGVWIVGYALFLHPFAGLLAGRDWRGLEIFGVTPDPTAIATIGAVLVLARGRRWPLLVIPVLWCVVSGFTLRAMKAPDGWILFAAAAAAVVFAYRGRRATSPAARGG